MNRSDGKGAVGAVLDGGTDCFLGHDLEDLIAQDVGLERLGDEAVGPALIGALAGFFLGMGRQHQHRKRIGPWIGPKPVEHFPPIHLGEADVQDHEVGFLGQCGLESTRAVFTHDDLHVCWTETHVDETADHGRVFNDEYAPTHDVSPSAVPYQYRRVCTVP
jgi:hypothetical protein